MSNTNYAVLTPYLVPAELSNYKAVNIGDGFILRGIERLIGRFPESLTFTSRTAPSDNAQRLIAQGPGVVLAGANQLHENFTPWPGLSGADLRGSGLRLVPFGVGLHGAPGLALGLSDQTRDLLNAIHEVIEFSSWRCPLTVAFLERELPHLSGRFLMTGCPVAYDAPVLDGTRFHDGESNIALTVTDREDFWEREIAILDLVADRFARAKRFLVLHQDFRALGPKWVRDLDPSRTPEALRRHAAVRGYEIIVPGSADEALAFYDAIDLHIGSRVHAHLHFLSRNKRSALVPVDQRALGLSAAYGFPLSQPQTIERDLTRDFEPVRQRIRDGYEVMRRFTASLKDL